MKAIRFTILCILIAVAFTGCVVGNLYQSPPPNIPLPFNKNETKINLYTASQGIGIQASYAATDHFVMIMNVHSQSGTYYNYPEFDNPGLSTTVSYLQWDAGGGYYTKLDTSIRFEIIGGLGHANSYYYDVSPDADNSQYSNTIDASGSFVHLFLQSDFGLVRKHSQLALGLRLSNLITSTYFNDSYPNYGAFGITTMQNYGLNGPINALFFEPYLTYAYGFKNVKLIASVTPSFKIYGSDVNLPVWIDNSFTKYSLYQNLSFSLGLLINFNRKDIKR